MNSKGLMMGKVMYFQNHWQIEIEL